MQYNEQELEREIGITQPQYERFCQLHTAITEKRQKYISSMQKDIHDCNAGIEELETQLSQKGQEMLVAKVAGDDDAARRIGVEVEEINTQIADMRQRISNYSKVDVNNLLIEDLEPLREAFLAVVAEVESNQKLIEKHRESLEKKQMEITNQINGYDSLWSNKGYITKAGGDNIEVLLCKMFGLSIHDESGKLSALKSMMGVYGVHNVDGSTPIRQKITEILTKRA